MQDGGRDKPWAITAVVFVQEIIGGRDRCATEERMTRKISRKCPSDELEKFCWKLGLMGEGIGIKDFKRVTRLYRLKGIYL